MKKFIKLAKITRAWGKTNNSPKYKLQEAMAIALENNFGDFLL